MWERWFSLLMCSMWPHPDTLLCTLHSSKHRRCNPCARPGNESPGRLNQCIFSPVMSHQDWGHRLPLSRCGCSRQLGLMVRDCSYISDHRAAETADSSWSAHAPYNNPHVVIPDRSTVLWRWQTWSLNRKKCLRLPAFWRLYWYLTPLGVWPPDSQEDPGSWALRHVGKEHAIHAKPALNCTVVQMQQLKLAIVMTPMTTSCQHLVWKRQCTRSKLRVLKKIQYIFLWMTCMDFPSEVCAHSTPDKHLQVSEIWARQSNPQSKYSGQEEADSYSGTRLLCRLADGGWTLHLCFNCPPLLVSPAWCFK